MNETSDPVRAWPAVISQIASPRKETLTPDVEQWLQSTMPPTFESSAGRNAWAAPDHVARFVSGFEVPSKMQLYGLRGLSTRMGKWPRVTSSFEVV